MMSEFSCCFSMLYAGVGGGGGGGGGISSSIGTVCKIINVQLIKSYDS